MKWIIILATLLSCSAPFALADEDMPLGDTNPVSQGGWGSSNSEANTATPKPRAKSKSAATMPKGTDYAPAQDLLLSAMSLIGVKYTWGGNSPESGLDCSGFIKYVFQNSMNITLPRTAFGMAQTGQNVDKSELKPGDLVFFNTLGRTFSHVGIYLGDNRFIHSPRAGRSVEVANMNQSYWQTRFNGGRRVADAGGQGLNVNAMLAASNNARPSVNTNAKDDAVQTTTRQCKKVTTGKGSKRKTVLQCSNVATNQAQAKPSSGAKPAKSNAAAKSSKSTKSASTKPTSRTAVKSSSSKKPATTSAASKKTAAPKKASAKK